MRLRETPEIVEIDLPTQTGEQAISSIGFQPSCVIGSASMATSSGFSTANPGSLAFFAFDSFQQGSMCFVDRDNVSTASTQTKSKPVALLIDFENRNNAYDASFVSMDSNGWIWNFSVANPAVPSKAWAVCIP